MAGSRWVVSPRMVAGAYGSWDPSCPFAAVLIQAVGCEDLRG